MCILDENDLIHIIKDKENFARFNLTERQRKIVMLHLLKGFTFEVISGIEKRSITAVHNVYTDAIKKIKKQLMKMLKEKAEMPVKVIQLADSSVRYIGGNGEVWDSRPENAPPRSVLMVGYV